MYEIEKPSARIAAAMARNECPSRCISTMQSIAASRPEQFDQLSLGDAASPAEGNDTAEGICSGRRARHKGKTGITVDTRASVPI